MEHSDEYAYTRAQAECIIRAYHTESTLLLFFSYRYYGSDC